MKNLLTRPKVAFLQEKIMELKQALFFDLSGAVLKLPTSLTNVLHVDEVGQVWFFISRPSQHVNEFSKSFLSRLDFYKKGKSFYLHLLGKASIINDPEEINNVIGLSDPDKQEAVNRMILVKLKIEDIYYYPVRTALHQPKPYELRTSLPPSAFIKTLQYIVKDIIPVFQSHG